MLKIIKDKLIQERVSICLRHKKLGLYASGNGLTQSDKDSFVYTVAVDYKGSEADLLEDIFNKARAAYGWIETAGFKLEDFELA